MFTSVFCIFWAFFRGSSGVAAVFIVARVLPCMVLIDCATDFGNVADPPRFQRRLRHGKRHLGLH